MVLSAPGKNLKTKPSRSTNTQPLPPDLPRHRHPGVVCLRRVHDEATEVDANQSAEEQLVLRVLRLWRKKENGWCFIKFLCSFIQIFMQFLLV